MEILLELKTRLAILETCVLADAVELYPIFFESGFDSRETAAALVALKGLEVE